MKSSKSTTHISTTVSTETPDNENKNVCEDGNPCKNGGTCEAENESYKCKCVEGYSGTNCEHITWCKDNKIICGSAKCLYINETKSGACFCSDDSFFDAKNRKCQKIDNCLKKRIKGECRGTHETCINGECECKEDYSYNNEKTKNFCEPDFCWKKTKKPTRPRCGDNMDCTESGKSYSCSCKEGFHQIDSMCIKDDKCTPGNLDCEQMCQNDKCGCLPGFDLNMNNRTCDKKNTTVTCSLNCGKGTCVKDGTSENCICPEISHVLKSNNCTDKCTANLITSDECPLGCLVDDHYGYICNCTGKYDRGDDYVHCKAKKMCSEGGGEWDCSSKNAYCIDDFKLPDGYKCKCKFGFEMIDNVCKHKCEYADCDKEQALCTISVDDQAICICPPLLVKDSSGKCSRLAKHSYVGDFSIPKEKYSIDTLENSGRTKRDTFKNINYAKLLKDFEDSMKKIFEDYKGTSVLNCTENYGDLNCFLEIKLDKDPGSKINLVSTPSVCLPLSDSENCLIQPDFVTKKRTSDDIFLKTNPCEKSVSEKFCGKETVCTNSEPGFKCECKLGYLRRTSFTPAENVLVEICEDINECLNPTICPNTTSCENLPGSYNCKCIDGYRIDEGKSIKIDGCSDVCDPDPCVHGECSKTGGESFSCSCDKLYTGRFCNQTIEVIKDVKKAGNETTAIVGGVLGALLLMAIIICIILFRKLQKPKSVDGTEENGRDGNHRLVSQMWKLGGRQTENNDIELRDNERRPNRGTNETKYNSDYPVNPIDNIEIPRPQIGRSNDSRVNSLRNMPEKRENGDYRREKTDDHRMNRDGDRQEMPRRPVSRSSDYTDNEVYAKPYSTRHSSDDRQRIEREDSRQEMPRRPKAYSSRFAGEEIHRPIQRDNDRQEMPRRPLSRSSEYLDNERIGVSRMQYMNRGYEED